MCKIRGCIKEKYTQAVIKLRRDPPLKNSHFSYRGSIQGMPQPPLDELESFRSWLMKYGRSESTADQYAAHIRRAFELDDPMMRFSNRDLSPKYLRLTKAALKAWATFSEDASLLKEVDQLRLPPALRQKEDVPLTSDEWKGLRLEVDSAEYLCDPVRAALGLLVCRGFRCGDVLRLKRSEVVTGLRKGTLNFKGKGSKRLNFTITDSWRVYLEVFLDDKDWERVEDLVSPKSPKGKTRGKSAAQVLSRALDKCCSKAGISPEDMHPHLLRHTYATLFYDKCKNPAKLQVHMGWGDIKIAMGYVNAGNQEELDAVAESLFD